MSRKLRAWTALLLAVVLSAGVFLSAWAESKTDAELQESLVTREGESRGTLTENLEQLFFMLQSEDVLSLLRIEDVNEITNEILVRILIWLIENRPVTMKILAELGADEEDQYCIGKIWDSADRIVEAAKTFLDSEDGRRLRIEAEQLENDPAFLDALYSLKDLLSEENLSDTLSFLSALLDTSESLSEEEALKEILDGSLIDSALDHNLPSESFTGNMMMNLMSIADEREAVRNALDKLLKNEHMWNLLIILSENNHVLDEVLREEFKKLGADPRVVAFITRIAKSLRDVVEKLRDSDFLEKLTGPDKEPHDENQQDENPQPEAEQNAEEGTP